MATVFLVLLWEKAGPEATLVGAQSLRCSPHRVSQEKEAGEEACSLLLPSSDGAGQWAGPEDVSLLGEQERRGLAGAWPGVGLPWSLGRRRNGEE